PCRMANKEMVPMKESLKDKDIVYIYITGETSPKGTWENMIPDIHGEHFYLTAEQWEYLGKAFGIDGVPTYLVIDRAGDVKYKSVGFPGVAKMKEELLKVAE
ncbi:MAG: TlpA family protein disulfide reductase, partial [Bacteroidaceae bacterium]|nr:TlpA family protein disulfide reductase [Bacteroidaceae bacterium]